MRKAGFLIIFFMFVILLSAQTAVMPNEGDGSENNPYQIASWQNLCWITALETVDGFTYEERLTRHYIQTADIIFPEEIQTWNNGEGWRPIGNFQFGNNSKRFSGIYDGNNRIISNLFINRADFYNGLFGNTRLCILRNINLTEVNITGSGEFTGGIVGYHSGRKLENCSVSGNINGTDSVGGLAGYSSDYVNECFFGGNVNGLNNVGGLIGNCDSFISNSKTFGTVNGDNFTGGMTGVSYGNISNCFSTCNIKRNLGSIGTYFGGFCGQAYSCIVKNAYSTGWVQFNAIIQNNKGFIGGHHEEYPLPLFSKCFWDMETSGSLTTGSYSGIEGKSTLEMKTQETFLNAGWNFNYPWKIETDSYPNLKTPLDLNIMGNGSPESPYRISNIVHLCWLSDNQSLWDKNFIQVSDIDFSTSVPLIQSWDEGKGWSPIGGIYMFGFTGNYDGNGYSVSGLYINRSEQFQGFFSLIGMNSLVKNISLINSSITGSSYLGGIAWQLNTNGVVDNCHFSGDIHAEGSLSGGLLGSNSGGLVMNSSANGTVNGNSWCGGFIGRNYMGHVINSYSISEVNGGTLLGGFIGENYRGMVENCFSEGTVNGNSETGGFCGSNSDSLRNCYSRANVNRNEGDSYTLGAFTGRSNSSRIEDCYSTGWVKFSGVIQDNKGFVGFAGNEEMDIFDCYVDNFFT